MDTAIIAIYCFVDDFFKARGHREDPQTQMSDAEVLTTALVAARFFGGNLEQARRLLHHPNWIPHMLSKSQFIRRLHRLAPVMQTLFQILGNYWLRHTTEPIFLIDSFPLLVIMHVFVVRGFILPSATAKPTTAMWPPNNAASMASKSTCSAPWKAIPWKPI